VVRGCRQRANVRMPLLHVQIEQPLEREEAQAGMPSAVRRCDHAAAKLAYGPLGRSDFGELADASRPGYVLRFHLLHPAKH
jgi:hypothetical protein